MEGGCPSPGACWAYPKAGSGEKYVFIDYNSSFKGYKLYNPSARKVIVIRNVEFDEEGTWNWTTQ